MKLTTYLLNIFNMMGNRNEVILHIGLHKTGTTSIQKSLSLKENQRILKENGYLYPTNWTDNHSIPVYSAFCDHPEKYHMNVRNGYSHEEIKRLNEKNLNSLEKEIVENNFPELIISGEDISWLEPHNLIELKGFLKKVSKNGKIKVIVCVRHPISWAVSEIQEIIKGGRSYEFALNHINNVITRIYRSRIEKFIEVFGKKSIVIYKFEDAVRHEYGLVGYFLSLLNFYNEEIKSFKTVKTNESTSQIAIELMSYMNKMIPMFNENGSMNKERNNGDYAPLLGINGPKFDIPYTDKLRIFEKSKEDREWLRKISGIGYTEVPQSKNLEFTITEEMVNQIKTAYCKLPNILKGLLVEYMNDELTKKFNQDQELIRNKLLNSL